MKEKSMMKQQRFAMQSQLSKVCRWLMCFGFAKVALLVALASGYSLPSFELLSFLEPKPQATAVQEIVITNHDVQHIEVETPKIDETTQAHTNVAVDPLPQGSAAVRAANQYKPLHAKPTANYLPETTIASSTTTDTIKTTVVNKPVTESPSWWNNVLNLKSLPFPRLGLDQVAYAATLNVPPPPTVASDNGQTPFTPPQQTTKQTPTSTAPRVLPAGTAGPQLGVEQANPLVPNPNPPTPDLNAYVPPEDPNQAQQELARREQELLMLKKQTEQRLKELQAAEKKVKGMLNEAKTVEGGKVNALTNMYINMKPKQAAKALETMDENIAVKILSNMKPKQAGEILSYANPAKTAELTELLSRMQLGN